MNTFSQVRKTQTNEAQAELPLHKRLHALAQVSGVITAALGAGHLAAWFSGMMVERGFSVITMKTNAALCLLALGAALALLGPASAGRARTATARACALLAVLISALTLGENLFGWDLGIDQLLVAEPAGALGTASPNRMGIPGSLSIFLAATALLIFSGGALWASAAQGMSLIVVLLALFPLIGYLYGSSSLYAVTGVTAIAWPTASALMVLGAGMLCARPGEGFMKQVTSADAGGMTIRRLLTPTVVVPIVLGWLWLAGEEAGLYNAQLGAALVMPIIIVAFTAFAYRLGLELTRFGASERAAHEALARTDSMLRHQAALIDVTPDAIITRTIGGTVKTWNKGAEKLYGWSSEEAVGRNVHSLIATQSAVPIEEIIETIKSGHDWTGELVHRTKDGRRVTVESFWHPHRVGDALEILESNVDRSERRRSEETLESYRLMLETVINHMPAAVNLIRGSDLRLQLVNAAYQAIAPRKDMVGKTLDEVWPETSQNFTALCKQVLETGEPYHVEDELNIIRRDPDGPLEPAYFSWSLNRVRLPGDEGWGVLNTAWETTERKRAEDILLRNQETFRNLIRDNPLGVYVVDSNLKFVELSRGARKAFAQGELVGEDLEKALRTMWQEPFASEAISCFRRTLTTGEPFSSASTVERRKDRPDVEAYDWRVERIALPNGTFGVVCYFYDLSDRMRLEDALRESEERLRVAAENLKEAARRKDEFLAVLAHELRNPMAAISAAAALLSRPGIAGDKARIANEALKRRIEQLARLVDDLLDVTRITRGKIELKKENIELEDVLYQAVESTRRYFEDQEQELIVRVSDRLPLYGDPVRLEQIIGNLLANASRYSEKGQEINVHAFRDSNEAVVQVKDRGMGISEELLAQIFEPFAQSENTLARTRGGLGLGLTIVKRLCEMHDGSVSVKSEGQGKGSEFEVRFPLGAGYSIAERAKMPHKSPAPLRILLVEDHADTALMQAAMLELEGHTVELANDGVTAVEKALSTKPDVMLLDIGLPGLNGYEVASSVRKAGLAQTVIVALTGYGQERDIVRAHEAGMDHHLLKPVDHIKLAAILAFRQTTEKPREEHYQ